MLSFHPHYAELPPETTIWRYLDFCKFEDLLRTSALYLCRADLLMQFDKKEGTLTSRMQQFIDHDLFNLNFVKNLKKNNVTTFGIKTTLAGRGTLQIRDELRQRARAHYRYILTRTYVNCWHVNNDEDVLMWQAYIRNEDVPSVVEG